MEKGYGFVFWKMLTGSLLLLLITLNAFLSQAASLSNDEIDALRVIGSKLGKTDWNFSADPCVGADGWTTKDPMEGFENELLCNCTEEDGCHVVSITLKSQNLSGFIPAELIRLPFLYNIDLTRNLLTGSIPPEWTTLPLKQINLMANRLSGPIHKEIGNITTLQKLNLEANGFSGPIPPEFGNLINLERVSLSSNNLNGQLPAEMSKLTNLVDLRISDNDFSGKVPNFIQNWRRLQILRIQGSSLEGPIPSGISSLRNLSDLRISDLSGMGSNFPDLHQMTSLKTLVLRNCLLNGTIPDYFEDMTDLKILDLSFNNLKGNIPSSLEKLLDLDFLFLTKNRLTGPVPSWIWKTNKNVDLSYNEFTPEKSMPSECQLGNINLFASHFLMQNSLSYYSCLEDAAGIDTRKRQYHDSLYINCGGGETAVGGNTYDEDNNPQGASFFSLNQNWAFSTTGNFMGDNDGRDVAYIATNTSPIAAANPELYTTARASPISLTYYGLHLTNRNYIVRLHFAEIIFTNQSAFTGLGRRLFDVYIQGKLVLKDFNIEGEAREPGKPIVKSFMASVTNHMLEINFFWAGKGTQTIPRRGEYGVLVSAISAEPATSPGRQKLSGKIVAVIIVLVVGCIALFAGVIFWNKKSIRRKLQSYQGATGKVSRRSGMPSL